MPPLLFWNEPLRMVTGLNFDRINAGYNPATIPMNIQIASRGRTNVLRSPKTKTYRGAGNVVQKWNKNINKWNRKYDSNE